MKKDSKRKLKVFLVLSGFTLSMTSVLASPVVMDQYNMGGKSWIYNTGDGSHCDIWFSDGYGDDGGAFTNWITMKGKITG